MASVPHVEIRPKPANGKNSSGAVSQMSAPRPKNGPLVFVNTSDQNTESERQGNRRTVKKWAMLNRNARYMRPNSTSQKAPQFLSWDSRGDRESSAAAASVSSASHDNPFSPPLTLPYNAVPGAPAAPTPKARPSVSYEPMAAPSSSRVDRLCLDVDPHARSLIDHHLASGGNDVLLPNGTSVSANRDLVSMLATSPAALCSLIATLETDTSNLMRSGDKDYRDYYLSMALMHTTTLIREMEKQPTPVVFYCVSLLMWISSNMGDEGALQAHFNGIIALMIRHWDLFSLTPYFRNGPFFWMLAQNEGNVLPGADEPSYYSMPTKEQAFHIELGDFANLQSHGWLSADLVSFLPHLLAMQALIARAKVAQLNLDRGRDLFAYILYNARMLVSLETAAITPLEHAVRLAAVMHYYVSIFRDSQHAVGWLSDLMYAHLIPLDMRDVVARSPVIVLWLALNAGVFATNAQQRGWWGELAANAVATLALTDYDEAAAALETRLLWARALDGRARRFWDEVVFGSRRSSGQSI